MTKKITHIKDLTPDPRNARKHNPRNIGMIERGLNELGAGRSILIDGDGEIIAGNGVIEAAAQAGIERVRVVETDGNEIIAVQRADLTGRRKKRMAILDNRAAELADWDGVVLAEIAETEQEVLDGLFSKQELEIAIGDGYGGSDADAEPQTDRATELNERWQVKTGDLWRIGDHRLLCGDSTAREDVEKVMQGRKVGACVTDSPYGINREGIENDDPEGLRDLFDGVLSAMPIDNGIVINFQSPRLFPIWIDAIRVAKHKFERMLWMYKPNDETFPWRGWLQKSEAILVSSKGSGEWLRVDPFAHDCYSPTTLGSELPKEWGKAHASVKPLVVVQDLISRIGGDVYEPFAGSGTTLVGCENLGRICFALESKPAHCAVILERMATAFPGIEIERIT